MHWFRVHAPAVAAATLVALVTLCAVTSLVHAAECHDEACALAVVRHDPASHSIASGANASAAGPLHCVLCHWTRSTRPSPQTGVLLARPAADNVLLHAEVLGAPSQIQTAQPPLRSPPFA